FDGETEHGMGIQDLYLRFCTIPTDKPMRIVAQHSNKDITVGNGSTNDVKQWSWDHQAHQTFYLDYKGDGYFALRAAHSGLVLDVPGSSKSDGVQLTQYNFNGTNNQLFRLDPLGGYWYRIAVKHSGKVLDVRGASQAEGAVVQQYRWANVAQQRWKIWRTQ
ncbi:MAG TPA: RICIN domain-containing protein, partial [Cystobacter sp.]